METMKALLIEQGYTLVFLGPLLENAGLAVPGDSALFWAAFLAASGHFRLDLLVAFAALGAALGDSAGYWVGRRGGRPLLLGWAGRWPSMGRALRRTEAFFARRGGATIFIARFVPGLRVCAALVAGATLMPWRRFLAFNCSGAVTWALVTAGIGNALGHHVAWVSDASDSMWRAGLMGAACFALLVLLQFRLARRLDP